MTGLFTILFAVTMIAAASSQYTGEEGFLFDGNIDLPTHPADYPKKFNLDEVMMGMTLAERKNAFEKFAGYSDNADAKSMVTKPDIHKLTEAKYMFKRCTTLNFPTDDPQCAKVLEAIGSKDLSSTQEPTDKDDNITTEG